MITIPISFLFSFSMIILLIWTITLRQYKIGFFPRFTLAALAIQSILLGLHWTYSYTKFILIQATLAALIPPMVLISLLQLVSTQASRQPLERIILHCLPAALILFSPFLKAPDIDFLIVGVFVGYGITLLYISSKPDLEWRDRVPFQGVLHTNFAFLIAGVSLLLSAFVDVAVSYDMRRNGGALAPEIVGVANSTILLLLAGVIVFVSRYTSTRNTEETLQPVAESATEDDEPLSRQENQKQMEQTLEQMERALIERKFYRDPDLSLDSLSRKLVIPSRQISTSVNSLRAMNVSQYINLFRITEAAYLLKNTDCSVTGVIFDVGFNTKSNFNREFRRIVAMSPSEWRKKPDLPKENFIANLSINLQHAMAEATK